jgi:hypothetical protein
MQVTIITAHADWLYHAGTEHCIFSGNVPTNFAQLDINANPLLETEIGCVVVEPKL